MFFTSHVSGHNVMADRCTLTFYRMKQEAELTPAPQSPHHCCPWSWTGYWLDHQKKKTSPAGGSAGSEGSAGGCCHAGTDTGSSSGHSKQQGKACTAEDM